MKCKKNSIDFFFFFLGSFAYRPLAFASAAGPLSVMPEVSRTFNAMSPQRSAPPPSSSAQLRVRKSFPETWIWETIDPKYD